MPHQLGTLTKKLQNVVIEEGMLSPYQKREIDAFTQHLDVLIAEESLDTNLADVAEQLIIVLEEDHPQATAIINSIMKILSDIGI